MNTAIATSTTRTSHADRYRLGQIQPGEKVSITGDYKLIYSAVYNYSRRKKISLLAIKTTDGADVLRRAEVENAG